MNFLQAMGVWLASIYIPLITLYTVSYFSNSSTFCEVLGWHKKLHTYNATKTGNVGKCPRCSKRINQSKKGTWSV